MQNDFGAEKGMFACAGIPIAEIHGAVAPTVRDAFFRDYHCLVLADCTAEPMGTHESTLRLVERFFGWVSDSSAFVEALGDGYWASALSGAAGTSAQRRS